MVNQRFVCYTGKSEGHVLAWGGILRAGTAQNGRDAVRVMLRLICGRSGALASQRFVCYTGQSADSVMLWCGTLRVKLRRAASMRFVRGCKRGICDVRI